MKDGTSYSKRKGFTPLHVPPLKEYAKIVGEEPIKKLEEVSERLSGMQMLELSSTSLGGGVAEMLHSSVPFLNSIGIDDEWKVIKGSKEFFEITKTLHHLLHGKKGKLTAEDEKIYFSAIKENVALDIIDYEPDVVFVHDPQPLALARELSQHDVFHWVSGFIRSVLETKRIKEELNMKKLSEKIREELKNVRGLERREMTGK
ncbi:MAG: hypothetical protein N2V75_10455 [Methanophagales archaeon]|nr:hypothetical protein [Methanophagales archaeon]